MTLEKTSIYASFSDYYKGSNPSSPVLGSPENLNLCRFWGFLF